MGRDARVGAEGDLDAPLVVFGEDLQLLFPDRQCLGHDDGRKVTGNFGLLRDEGAGAQGGHHVGTVLLHELGRLGVHQRTVLDGGDAGADGAAHSLVAVGVGGGVHAVLLGGGDNGLQFLLAKLRPLAIFGYG